MAKAITKQEHAMDVINRAVAIIKPRQPYLDWAINLPDAPTDLTLDDLRRDCTAILLPEADELAEAEVFIARIYTAIFEMELEAWSRDRRVWPATRTYHTFREWFDLEVHSTVLDAASGRITHEAY